MKIKASLTVAQKDWKFVYASLLNFVNQEIATAYDFAVNIYNNISDVTYDDFLATHKLSAFQKHMIENSMFQSDRILKPKKQHFRRLTNRSTSIDLIDNKILVDKLTNSITFETIDYDMEIDDIFSNINFLSEFMNMVQTIEWPTRIGPVRAVRGCSVVSVSEQGIVQFFKSGSNPPTFNIDNDITLPEPKFLKATALRNIAPLAQEEHFQEVEEVNPEFC